MTAAAMQPRVAILIFAESQARDLRRRGLPSRLSNLLSLPAVAAPYAAHQADVHWFCDRPARVPPAGVTVHRQRGRSFGERLENAIADLTERGYDRVVIVGRDCPQLTAADVSTAIDALQSNRLVLGPDHRGGCWLIGLHTADRARLRGICWQQDTDAAALRSRFAGDATVLLETKFDLDRLDDLRHLTRVFDLGLYLSSPIKPARRPGECESLLSFIRLSEQLPPPARAPYCRAA